MVTCSARAAAASASTIADSVRRAWRAGTKMVGCTLAQGRPELCDSAHVLTENHLDRGLDLAHNLGKPCATYFEVCHGASPPRC